MRTIHLVFFIITQLGLINAQSKNTRIPNLQSVDKKTLHFGFLIGFNTMDFRVYNSGIPTSIDGRTLYADVVHIKPGLNIGMVSSYRLTPSLNLRFLPGISFGQRNLHFISKNGMREAEPLKIKSTFLEFPLLLKYNAKRMHNTRPYLIGGLNIRYDLAKDKQDRLLLHSLDKYLEFGAGFDFYFTYFRLSVELKGSIGFDNILNKNWTKQPDDKKFNEALDALRSRIFCLTFYFES